MTFSKTIDAYRVRNRRARPGSRKDGIPYTGTFLVDDRGVIRAKLFGGVVFRPTTEQLIEAAEALPDRKKRPSPSF